MACWQAMPPGLLWRFATVIQLYKSADIQPSPTTNFQTSLEALESANCTSHKRIISEETHIYSVIALNKESTVINNMARKSTFTSLALVAAPLLLLVCASLATPATATGDCWAVCNNNQKHCNAMCDQTGHKSSCYGKCGSIQRSCSSTCDRKSQACFSKCSSKQQSCGQECQYKVQEASQCFKNCEEYPKLCVANCNKNHIGQECIDACNSAKVMNACSKGCSEQMQEVSGCWDDCKKDQLDCNNTCRGPFEY